MDNEKLIRRLIVDTIKAHNSSRYYNSTNVLAKKIFDTLDMNHLLNHSRNNDNDITVWGGGGM